MTCGCTIALTSLSLHFPRPSLFICVLFHDLSFCISDRLIRSVHSFSSCKAYQDTSPVHRICDTFLRPPYLQSQALTNTRDNKLICQFLDFLTFWKRSTARQRYHYSKRIFHNPGCHEHTRLKRNLDNITGKEERNALYLPQALQTRRIDIAKKLQATAGPNKTTRFQDQLPPAKDHHDHDIKPPINRTTSPGLRTPFNSSIGRHQAIETTESTIEADKKKHSHNNGSPPRPRLLETLQLRSPPRRRSPSK